ncbi:MAG TPA: helix-turn-helix domain-containing GNAT family N-acetyltransferase [Bryobacteraceae bacterium]|jgi:DNA-binding MarR family transcriptional regulator/ribosomal protein S18 acetylase RimI-like enzyme|nr:helix-turn-helix domain-containing GNAT family N-acetyltransferase [Bryobacteraceae bacterium]
MPVPPEKIQLVRRFNRFYTRRLGLLREGLLDTPFSLTQARVLFEIAHRPGTRSADLAAELGLDAAYLSRLLVSFERRKLLTRRQSRDDRRVNHLRLTTRGRAAFARLDSLSRAQSGELLAGLTGAGQQRLTDSMAAIQEVLTPAAGEPAVALRTHRAGDIGWVVARHGEIYTSEYGWDNTFEGLVAEIAGKFLGRFDPARERCWIAELNGQRAGSVFLVKHTATVAKLRLLLVEPSARGHSLGTRLVDACVAFAREAGYRKLTLWTQNNLHAARRIYRRAGFQLAEEGPYQAFGVNLVQQVWDLKL